MWNDLSADIKLCNSIFTFKKMYKALLLQPYQFCNAFVLLTCTDYLLHVT